MDYEVKMREAQAEALRKIRYEFQERYPHYTPPPDAGMSTWQAWFKANIALHGWDGFKARFPKHARFLENPPGGSEEMKLYALRDFSYGRRGG